MDPLQLQASSLTKKSASRQTTLSLPKGQVFEGEITKLFPNQTAALRLGGMNVTARVEAALHAGQRYFFQVSQNDGIPRLQVLEADQQALKSTAADQGSAAKVLQALGLEENKANLSMIRHFQQEQLPFSKEMIRQGAAVLKQAGVMNQEGVQLLSAMNQKSFPLTLETFQSLYQAEHGKPLSTQIQQLQSGLQQLQATGLSGSRDSAVSKLAGAVQETVSAGMMNQSGRSDAVNQLARLFQLAGAEHAPGSVQSGAVSLLHKAGVMPAGMDTAEGLAAFKQTILLPENRGVVQEIWPETAAARNGRSFAAMESAELFQTLMTRFSPAEGEAGRQQLQLLLSLMQQAGGQSQGVQTPQASQEQLQQLMQTILARTSGSSENQALTVLLQGSFANERAGGTQGFSQTAGQFMQLLQQLGLHHESGLAQQTAATSGSQLESMNTENLKQSLLQHMASLPQPVRDQAEALLHKISGQQLLSQEQQGQFQQTAVQIPLSLAGFHTDLSIQWEGKRQQDGTLHPDHCRILFYLEMEHLGETVADVQIQNRSVTVHVYNETQKPDKLMELLQPYLEKRLAEQNYTLNAVHWKSVHEEQHARRTPASSYSGWEGVDVRI
ncbi:hypothetical protein [Salibacterium halotolerans]|uniref:Hook-length control protein FliK n=1 Tax=Salibacterium halotolerans TaxID=1884432 RepID=A0A1I5MBP8_9BACI|nr:hypothetical protein [Salibacterium halotolerans]SFP06929.1 hypothetical protein SAMN05518683_102175 [Salibacterium halotolerans]